MESNLNELERREFIRLEFSQPLAYKVCKPETISTLLNGYTSNISKSGILCNIDRQVNNDDILWLSFDRGGLAICEDREKRTMIYQGGIIGKVVRVNGKEDGTFEIGLHFITREEEKINNVVQYTALLNEKY